MDAINQEVGELLELDDACAKFFLGILGSWNLSMHLLGGGDKESRQVGAAVSVVDWFRSLGGKSRAHFDVVLA